MVKHIVFFKLIDNTKPVQEEIKKQLLSLKDHIRLLKEIEVGINFAHEGRAYDIVLIATFNTKDDLQTYANHPYHIEVIKYIKTVTSETKVVDFTN